MGLHTMTDHSISEKIEYKYLSFINKVFLVVHIGHADEKLDCVMPDML